MYVDVIDSEQWLERLADGDSSLWSDSHHAARSNAYVDSQGNVSVRMEPVAFTLAQILPTRLG